MKAAAELLQRRYGRPDRPASTGWPLAVRCVLGGAVESEKSRRILDALVAEPPLDSAAVTAGASAAQLADVLKDVPRGDRQARRLKSLAEWWISRFGDELDPEWPADVEALRSELRSIRGLGMETADRLLLFVGGLPAFPVDRSVLRVACRHGWLDLTAEYEEWQSLFVRGMEGSPIGLRELSAWLSQVGREHCGPVAKCSGCPLEPLLPPGGPYEPE